MSFAHAQTGVNNFVGANSTSISATLASNPAQGDVICVATSWFDGVHAAPGSISVSDGNSNVYTKSPNSPIGNLTINTGASYLFYLIAPANAHKTITATFDNVGTSGSAAIYIDDFSVTGAAASFDQDTVGSGNSSTLTSPTVATAGTGELLYAVANPKNTIDSVGAPWTVAGAATLPTSFSDGAEYLMNAGATAVAFTQNVSGIYQVLGMSFKQASATLSQWEPRIEVPARPKHEVVSY